MRTRLRNGGISLIALAALLAAAGALRSDTPQTYPGLTKRDKAYFLAPEIINFVRPGLIVKIVSASIAPDGTIKAEITMTDNAGLALDRLGVNTPGAVSVSFVPAVLPNNRTEYLDYATLQETDPASGRTTTEARTDPNGTWTQVGDGDYIYTFGTKATNFDATATHTVGLYASRNLTAFNAGTQYSNDVYTWVPNGSPVTHVHSEIVVEACNQCHDPLAAHGGARRDVRLCVLCHTDQSTDAETNNTVDFRVMIHKIHMGAELPSVKAGTPYTIVGFQNSVNDFSKVEFPALGPNNCQFCHAPKLATAPAHPAADPNAWLEHPNRAACGACHDNVNFATGQNHANLPQLNDNLCTACHFPQGETEFDVSIIGAHLIPEKSTQLPGVVFAITNITNGGAGQSPKVTFTVKDKAGNPIAPSTMNSLNLVLAYPTIDYQAVISEDARKAAANSDGTYTYAFTAAVPAGTKGTGTIGVEGYRNITLNANTVQAMTVRNWGQNVDVNFSIDGSAIRPRRVIVTTQNCDQCHDHLEAHGGFRNEISHCVLCHNPNATDTPFRPANQQPPQGIAFKMMVHRIHTGEDQESDYTIYAFGGTPNNFQDIAFPGDRRDCVKCHVPGTQEIPVQAGELPVVNPRGFINPEGPITAACLGCHTAQDAAAHAQLNTSANLGEACTVCHGQGAQFSVDSEHAR
ncbi:MAG: OmcA/MtrC family decaheme c-type cytochrome [Acidobacteriia bacterium]|nr:OmcA/MtrC family decaheme c-type cytochrome [Terriglobia bacterium]